MAENRKNPRNKTPELHLLANDENGETIGRIIDLSLTGMRVWSEQPIEDMTYFRCKVALWEENSESTPMNWKSRKLMRSMLIGAVQLVSIPTDKRPAIALLRDQSCCVRAKTF